MNDIVKRLDNLAVKFVNTLDTASLLRPDIEMQVNSRTEAASANIDVENLSNISNISYDDADLLNLDVLTCQATSLMHKNLPISSL